MSSNTCKIVKNSTSRNHRPSSGSTNVDKTEKSDGSALFPNLFKLVKYLLTLPHSTAAVERIFSVVTNNKIKKRNRLEEPTRRTGILHGKGLLKKRKKTYFNFNAKPLLNLHKSYRCILRKNQKNSRSD